MFSSYRKVMTQGETLKCVTTRVSTGYARHRKHTLTLPKVQTHHVDSAEQLLRGDSLTDGGTTLLQQHH